LVDVNLLKPSTIFWNITIICSSAGRNRQHQGLARAMVKLWEKSAIAKIAIKRGVPNTCNERMAEEIKVDNLT